MSQPRTPQQQEALIEWILQDLEKWWASKPTYIRMTWRQ